MDQRYLLLHNWLTDTLHPHITIQPLAGDASFRRYFRISQGKQTYVAMDAPPDNEDLIPFMRVADTLQKQGVIIPIILKHNLDQGFLLLSDLGDEQLLQKLTPDTVETLYQQAFSTLQLIQRCDTSTLLPFDEGMILRELSLFVEWFLQKHLTLTLNTNELGILNQTFQLLVESAHSQPQCFVHRDYHSRNLLYMPTNQLGVLDFQDAVYGPITYDLVSLIRDCYISWPEEQVTQWALAQQQILLANKLLQETSPELFLRWLDWMGIQRHLKAIGIFSRLKQRGKPQYIQDIPRTLQYIYIITSKYPELKTFHTWLTDNNLIATHK